MRKIITVVILILVCIGRIEAQATKQSKNTKSDFVEITSPLDPKLNLSFRWGETLDDVRKRHPDLEVLSKNQTKLRIVYFYENYIILFTARFNFDTTVGLCYMQHDYFIYRDYSIPIRESMTKIVKDTEKIVDFYYNKLKTSLSTYTEKQSENKTSLS